MENPSTHSNASLGISDFVNKCCLFEARCTLGRKTGGGVEGREVHLKSTGAVAPLFCFPWHWHTARRIGEACGGGLGETRNPPFRPWLASIG